MRGARGRRRSGSSGDASSATCRWRGWVAWPTELLLLLLLLLLLSPLLPILLLVSGMLSERSPMLSLRLAPAVILLPTLRGGVLPRTLPLLRPLPPVPLLLPLRPRTLSLTSHDPTCLYLTFGNCSI